MTLPLKKHKATSNKLSGVASSYCLGQALQYSGEGEGRGLWGAWDLKAGVGAWDWKAGGRHVWVMSWGGEGSTHAHAGNSAVLAELLLPSARAVPSGLLK